MSIGKRLRFEVFKRDGFACRYCGANPMSEVLQVDHVVPVSKGGTNDPVNLVTSCFSCNSGKSNVELGESRLPPSFSADAIKEHAEQTKEYLKAQKAMISARSDVSKEVEVYWLDVSGLELTGQQMASVRRFCGQLTLAEIIDSIDTAISRVPITTVSSFKKTFSYFCGICWNKIKTAKGEPA
jgi:DNA-directed RNA polymerase subunit RPC12/RpoP